MDKILFLDIDGVLNSQDDVDARHNSLDKTRDEFGALFDERCVRWLKCIIDRTNCKIVLSSSWRCRGLNKIQLLWEIRDLPGEVIDITPTEVSSEVINLYAATNNEADRGYEIQEWIDINKPEKYCIVDDDDDMLGHQNFVKTNKVYGLDYKTANLIVSILNAE